MSIGQTVFGLEPVHLHLLTNHIPIFMTLAGLIALALGVLWKIEDAKRAALVVLILGAAGGPLTYWLGEQSYDTVRKLADDDGRAWLDAHWDRAEDVIWLYWVSLVVSLGSLVMLTRNVRRAGAAVILAGLLAAGTLGAAIWVASAGGNIRHPEVRTVAPPDDE